MSLINDLLDNLFNENIEDYDKVQDAISRNEEMDSDEWDNVYDSVGSLGKEIMDEASNDFADSAIGDSSWRLGTDFED